MSNFDRARWTRDAKLESPVKLLLHTVISFADNKTGEAHPSVATLAYGMGVTKRTVHAAINAAMTAGVLIAAESRGRRAGVRPQDTTRKFKIIDSVLAEQADRANQERAQIASMQNLHPCNPCTPRVQSTHSKGAGIAPDPTNEQTNEPKHKAPPAKPSAELVDSVLANCTWKAVGPNGTRRAIAKSIRDVAKAKSVSFEQAAAFLAERSATYAASPLVERTEMRFRSKPSNWFRDGHYDDDPATWQTETTPSSTQGPATTGRRVSQLSQRY